MIWRLAVLAACLALASAGARCAAGDVVRHDAEDLLYWSPQRPVFVRLSLTVDGQSHRAAWNQAAGRLFDAFDRNGDGTVASDEGLSRLLSLVSLELIADPAASGPNEPPPIMLRKDAMSDLLESRGIGPLCIASAVPEAARPPAGAPNQVRSVDNHLLLAVLDENRSGDLSAVELLLSRRPKLDLDDDECLSAGELLTAQLFAIKDLASRPAARTSLAAAAPVPRLTSLAAASSLRRLARELMVRYDANRDGLLAPEEAGLGAHDATVFDHDHNARLDVEEIAQMLRRPIPTLTLECRWPEEGAPVPRMVDLGDQKAVVELSSGPPAFNREPLLQLFSEIDRNRNEYLEPSEAEGSQPIKRAFRLMDIDANQKLVADELLEYGRRVALLAPWQIVVTFQTPGGNVFETIDANRDGKLSIAELDGFAARIPDWDTRGNGAVAAAEISSTARFTLGPAASWTLSQGGRSPVQRPSGQPVWFARMDRNQDGVVSRREFLGPPERHAALDADGNGLLDLVEATAGQR